jgi:hypothetical protein
VIYYIIASQSIARREKSWLKAIPHKAQKNHGVRIALITPSQMMMQPNALILAAQLTQRRLRLVSVSNVLNSMVLLMTKRIATKKSAWLRIIKFLESTENARFVKHLNIQILQENYAYPIHAMVIRS